MTKDTPPHLLQMDKAWVQDKAYEINTALSAMHREINAWRDFTLGGTAHDAGRVVNAMRHTVKALSALADQIEIEAKRTMEREDK